MAINQMIPVNDAAVSARFRRLVQAILCFTWMGSGPLAAEQGGPQSPVESPLPLELQAPADPKASPEYKAAADSGAPLLEGSDVETLGTTSDRERRAVLNPCERAPDEQEELIDKTRRALFEAVCNSGRWLDDFFGDETYRAHARRTHGRFGLRLLGDENRGLGAKVTFRANIVLPNLENRVNVFLGRENQDEFVTDRDRTLRLVPDFFRNQEDRDWLLGVGYHPIGGASKGVNFDAGIKVRTPLDPYLRGRHRRFWLISKRYLARTEQAVYWRNQRGFGVSASVDFERRLTRSLLLRQSNLTSFDQRTEGVDWRTGLALFQMVGEDRAFAYQILVDGETDAEVPVAEWGGRVTVRQRMFREWFFGEVLGGVAWVRDRADAPREPSFYIGVGFEMQFGFESDRGSVP